MTSTREEVSGGDSCQNLFEAAACLLCAQMDVRPPPGWISPRDIPQRHQNRKLALLKEIFSQKFHNIIRSWCCDSGWRRKNLEDECKADWDWEQARSGLNVSCRLALSDDYDILYVYASVSSVVLMRSYEKVFCFSYSECLWCIERLIPPISCLSKLLNAHNYSRVLQLWSSNISIRRLSKACRWRPPWLITTKKKNALWLEIQLKKTCIWFFPLVRQDCTVDSHR